MICLTRAGRRRRAFAPTIRHRFPRGAAERRFRQAQCVDLLFDSILGLRQGLLAHGNRFARLHGQAVIGRILRCEHPIPKLFLQNSAKLTGLRGRNTLTTTATLSASAQSLGFLNVHSANANIRLVCGVLHLVRNGVGFSVESILLLYLKHKVGAAAQIESQVNICSQFEISSALLFGMPITP